MITEQNKRKYILQRRQLAQKYNPTVVFQCTQADELRAEEYAKLRYGMTFDESAWLAAKKSYEELAQISAEHSAVIQELSKTHHMVWRDTLESPLRAPINYMDVMPASVERHVEIIDLICKRDQFYAKYNLGWPSRSISCRNVPRRFFESNYLFSQDWVEVLDIVKKMNATIIPPIIEKLRPMLVNSPRVKFCFDGRKWCDEVRAAGEVHLNDIIYLYGLPSQIRGKSLPPNLRKLEYKIANWFAYEALHQLLSQGYGGTIVFNDPNCSRLSYFFTRLGNKLCHHHVELEFRQPPNESPAADSFQVHDLDPIDMVGVQAIYFGHWHEFYHLGPTFFKKDAIVIVQSELYKQYLNKESIYEKFSESQQLTPTPEDEAKYITIEENKAKKSVSKSPELVIVNGAPGSGKSTYIRRLSGYYSLTYDDYYNIVEINGKSLAFLNEVARKQAESLFSDIKYQRLRKILSNTLWLAHRATRGKGHAKLAQKIFDHMSEYIFNNPCNTCLEEIGNLTNKIGANSIFKYDSCREYGGEYNTEEFHNKYSKKYRLKAVYVYNSIITQVNQQSSRSLVENRFVRYSRTLLYNSAVWSDILPVWKSKAYVYGYSADGQLTECVNAGKLDCDILHRYAAREMLGCEFITFLRSISTSGIDRCGLIKCNPL